MTASETLSLRYYEICAALLHRWGFSIKNDKNDMNEACRRCGASYEELRSILKYLRAQYLNNYLMATKRGAFSGDLFAFYTATKKRPGGNRRSSSFASSSSFGSQATPPRYPTGAGDLIPAVPGGWYDHTRTAYSNQLSYASAYASLAASARRKATSDLRLMRQTSDPTGYRQEHDAEDAYLLGLAAREESGLPLKKRHRLQSSSEEGEVSGKDLESHRQSKSQRLGRKRRVPSWLLESDDESELHLSDPTSSVKDSDADVDLNEDDEAAASVLLGFASGSKSTPDTSAASTPAIAPDPSTSHVPPSLPSTSLPPTIMGNKPAPSTSSQTLHLTPTKRPSTRTEATPTRTVASLNLGPIMANHPSKSSLMPHFTNPFYPLQQMDRSMQTLALTTPPKVTSTPPLSITTPVPPTRHATTMSATSHPMAYLPNNLPPHLLSTALAASRQYAMNARAMQSANRTPLPSAAANLLTRMPSDTSCTTSSATSLPSLGSWPPEGMDSTQLAKSLDKQAGLAKTGLA